MQARVLLEGEAVQNQRLRFLKIGQCTLADLSCRDYEAMMAVLFWILPLKNSNAQSAFSGA